MSFPYKLSVIITTRNRYTDLMACLSSLALAAKKISFPYEVVIVDDASGDKTAFLTIDDFPNFNISIIKNRQQEMMVRSRNLGAKNARGELLLFIDDDNVIGLSMLDRLVAFADANQEYGIIGPRMCFYPSKNLYLSYQKINFITGKTSAGHSPKSDNCVLSDGVPNVFMVRKNLMERCGYFDEKIVQTYTEPDLAFAAKRLGFKCGIIQNTETYHNIPEVEISGRYGGNQFSQKAFFLMRNRTVMIGRYGKWYEKFIYLLIFSWLWPISYSIIAAGGKRFDLIELYWRGYFAGIKYFFGCALPDSSEVIKSLVKVMQRLKNNN